MIIGSAYYGVFLILRCLLLCLMCVTYSAKFYFFLVPTLINSHSCCISPPLSSLTPLRLPLSFRFLFHFPLFHLFSSFPPLFHFHLAFVCWCPPRYQTWSHSLPGSHQRCCCWWHCSLLEICGRPYVRRKSDFQWAEQPTGGSWWLPWLVCH